MVGIIADEVKFFKKDKSTPKKLPTNPNADINSSTESIGVSKIKAYLPNYGKSWIKVPHLLRLNLILLIVSLTSTNTGYDGSLLNAFQSIPDWVHAMGNPTGAVLGAIANGVVFGCALGFPVAPWISDRLGRRHAITVGNAIMIVGALIQSVSGTWLTVEGESREGFTEKRAYAMFLIARIILGFGNTIAIISSPPLISELTYPSHRQPMTAFFNSNWYLGAIIAAWVSYGTRHVKHNWSWRIPSIFQGFFPILQISLIYLVPESPRYLISKGRFEEARAILLKHHAGGDEVVGGPLVDFEMSEIELALEQERIANDSSYADFLKTPGNRKRLFLVIFIGLVMQLSGNGLVSYYLNLVLKSIGVESTDEQLVFNGGLMIYNYAISIAINLLVFQNIRRRLTIITAFSLMLTFYVIWTILSAINQQRNFEDTSLGKGVMAMIFLYYFAYNLGLNGLPFLYVTEITPFILRTRAVNIMFCVQQITLIYNGFVNPIAMDAIKWRYYIVYCVLLFIELIVAYLTIVETSGRSLEEVAEVFGEGIDDFKLSVTTNNKKDGHVSHVEQVDTRDGSVSGPSSTSDKNNIVRVEQV
ncbi:Hexose transporter 2 [Wickerhamomyces ciferrii]|uniref:Hexose transporter 2 n=1 Tax=Wickerhamomyces ciferrii (strain ATCC 14091 / BCRC 22168 / CBS 111 / JCM 3599 / NBRC 0793 / NRRL Y-1031 F-60-10) TaxID=1206466 RepID=K0KIN3_WICCF|nr:Hexose transporter 2 [Wickerhamomyces ciferrii]CCH41023.1 Hexose transporter 2 [Wickerhamomyces ciferrii]